MKRGILIASLVVFAVVPLVGLAQEEDPANNAYGLWKRNYASPTYGVAIFSARVKNKGIPSTSGTFQEGEFNVPALDIRIMKGTNVSKRGGFYTGVEVGAIILIPASDEVFFDDVVVDDPTDSPYPDAYTFNVEVFGGSVFIMMKYGLRIDLGPSLFGLSAGFELGAGASLQAGGYRIVSDIAESDSGTEEVSLNLMVEPSLELAIRLGRNFRLMSKINVLVMPTVIQRQKEIDTYVLDNVGPHTPEDYRRYALQQYEVELGSVGYGIRLGFAVNFN
jgi:hypothetical protein